MNTQAPALRGTGRIQTLSTLAKQADEVRGDRDALCSLALRVRKLSPDIQRDIDQFLFAQPAVERADRTVTDAGLRLLTVESVREVVTPEQLAAALRTVITSCETLLHLVDEHRSAIVCDPAHLEQVTA